MSLFLAFGTAMAQNEENAEFALIYMEPANGAMKNQLSSIYMVFSKDITIALPEGGIDAVNTGNQEVVKITKFYEDKEATEHREAIFYFDTQLSAGNWTCTIPAGVITSVDNEVYPEITVSFSIMSTFEVVDWSPKEASSVETIVVTFDREITDAKLPERGLEVLKDWWNPVTKVIDVAINQDDKKSATLTLESPITTPGSYSLPLSEGIFISGDAISVYCDAWFTVIDPAPRFETNYQDGDKVKELGNFEITFKNVKEVVLLQDKLTVYLPGSGEAEGTATLADNKITVTFNQQFTEEGDYLFYIPEGMFTMDGVKNEERQINVNLYTFSITPLEIVSVTPAVGKVDQIANITITFNQPVQLYYNKEGVTLSSKIVLKSGENEYVLYSGYSNDLTSLVYTTDEWTGTDWAANPITAEGAYTLDLSTIVVNYGAEDGIDEYGYPAKIWHAQNYSLAGTYTWTIGNDAAVDNIKVANGEQAIYDLLGRRVERITEAGLYIVNGKKVIIK